MCLKNIIPLQKPTTSNLKSQTNYLKLRFAVIFKHLSILLLGKLFFNIIFNILAIISILVNKKEVK